MKNILLQADLLDPATNTTVTIRMSAAHADARGVLVNDIEWLPVIITGPTTSITVFSNGQPQAAEIEYGDIQFLMHPDMGNNHWSHLDWTSADISIWTGPMGAAWAEYTQIYAGKCGPIERDGLTGQIALVGNEAILEANLLTGEFAGTGGSQGAAGLRGNPRPKAFGLCENIAPVLIDQAYQVYQFHDGQADDVLMVYDNALEVAETAVATVSSYVELCALSLEPGEWAKAPAVGMFRLGGAPNGKLTADVRGHSRDGLYFNTIGIIVPEILRASGIDPAKIDMTSIGAFEQEWSLYLTSQTTCGEAARSAFTGLGYMFCGTDGVFRAGNFWNDQNAVTLNANRSSEPLVRSMKQLAASPPNYSVKVGGRPCWSVHTASEISEAVWLAGQGVEAAQEQADIALAQANQANARLESIANDDVLDRTEKYDLVTEYNRILDEAGEIDAKAEYFQITTERDAYNAAVAALVAYLTALTPAYNNTATETPISGGEFRAKFAAVYSTRQTLLNKLVEEAGKTANWSSIDGSGKPEDGATVGAPSGTVVGSKTADDVIAAITDATGQFIAATYLRDNLNINTEAVAALALSQDDLKTVVDARTLILGQPVSTALTEFRNEQVAENDVVNTFMTLMGAKNAAGTAWLLDGSSVQLEAGKSLSQTINEIGAKAADNSASITNLNEVLVSADGASAKSVLQIDVNGHVTGVINTNNGMVGQFTVVTDVFRLIDPNSGGVSFTPFSYADNKFKLTNVEVDTLKAGSVETDSLVVNSVTKKQFWQDNWSAISSSSLGALSDDVWYDFGLSTDKAGVSFSNAYDGGEVSLKWFVNLQRTGGDNDRVWFRVMRSFNGGAFTQVGDILRAGMGNFPMMIHYEWIDTGLATGSYDYKIQFYRDEGAGSYYSAKLIVDLGFR